MMNNLIYFKSASVSIRGSIENHNTVPFDFPGKFHRANEMEPDLCICNDKTMRSIVY